MTPPVQIVSDDEAEKAAFLVCAPRSTVAHFDDDEFGHCCACGVEVRFRPHAPKTPPRLCLTCALEKLKGEH